MGPANSNPNIPQIVVQIVHIEGPRKGEIDEISAPRILIGRDPACDVVFPKDLRIVSRKHAEIIREGNRFLLKNYSPNGCFVNGQPAEDAYLKQGDVITFASGGPKVSFLSTVQAAAKPRTTGIQPTPGPSIQPTVQPTPTSRPIPAMEESGPFTIQYGTTIRSFTQHAVTLGKEESNTFVLAHPRVMGQHAEIYFQNKQYFLKDLSGCNATLLNGRPIHTDTPLQFNDIITFGDGGPQLKYLDAGRLAEVIAQAEQQTPAEMPSISVSRDKIPESQKEPSVKDLFKSFFKK
jgi:pSer/pThr/pTyr-binding forkhead associated (FHA) protein